MTVFLQLFLGSANGDGQLRGLQGGSARAAVSGALYVIAALADGLSEGTVIPHPQLSKPISIIFYILDLQGDLRRMWSEPFIAQQPSKQLEV